MHVTCQQMVWLPHSQPTFTAFAPKLVEDAEGLVLHLLSWRHRMFSQYWLAVYEFAKSITQPVHMSMAYIAINICPPQCQKSATESLHRSTAAHRSHVRFLKLCHIATQAVYKQSLISQPWCTSHMYSIKDCVATNLIFILFRFDMSIFCGVNGVWWTFFLWSLF